MAVEEGLFHVQSHEQEKKFDLPAKSADLNPIRHLCDELKRTAAASQASSPNISTASLVAEEQIPVAMEAPNAGGEPETIERWWLL